MSDANSHTNGDEAALTVRVADRVATLILNRPAVHNAFDDALIAELTRTLAQIDNEPGVHLVLLAANGKSFCAGADLNWMRRMAGYSRQDNRRDSLGLARLMQTLDRLAQPTIAQIQGATLGGGLGLVACCDIAIAADSAFFALSEVRLGLTPSVISPYLVRAMGERHAKRLALTAERFDAQRACELGLVHEVVPAAELSERVAELISAMQRNGPQAMRAVKTLLREVTGRPIDNALIQRTAEHIADMRAGDEARAGIDAFLEKRQPDWIKHGE